MFQKYFTIIPLIISGFSTVGSQIDSTQILFSLNRIATYSLEFYQADWANQLSLNYSNEEAGYLPARFSDGNIVLDSVGVRYKGNSSYSAIGNSPKKPFKIRFDSFRSGQSYYGISRLNFNNGFGDPTFMREKLAYDIAAKYLPSPRAAFANLKVSTTGSSPQLLGLFTQVEQVDKPFLLRTMGNNQGNLFKASDHGASLLWEGEFSTSYEDNLELKTNKTINDWSGMVTFLNFLNNSSDLEFCQQHSAWFDPTNTTRWLAFNSVIAHFDSYTGSGRNYYMAQNNSAGRMLFIPWDLNLAFGGYSNGWDVVWQSSIEYPNLQLRPLLRRVLQCTELRHQYLGWMRDMLQGPAHPDTLAKSLQTMANILRPHVEADPNKFYRIGGFDSNQVQSYRASSTEIIPGIISLMRERSPEILHEISLELSSDYVLPTNRRTIQEFPPPQHFPLNYDLLGRYYRVFPATQGNQ